MTDTLRIVLDGHKAPSWNMLYSGVHWSKRSAMKNDVTMAVRVALPDAVVNGEGYPYQVPVRIEVHAHYSGRMLDADNIVDKLYIDALKGWVIEDDTPKYVVSAKTVPHKAKTNRVEIVVIPDIRQAEKEQAK